MPRLKLGRKKGFTIVELLVVIVVIGILTAIVIVSYGAWQTSTRTAQVKSDLSGAAQAMEAGRNFNNTTGGYPATLSFTASSGVNLSLYSSVATSYCINGSSAADSSIKYYIDSLTGSKGPQAGDCASRTNLPVPGTPTSPVAGSITDTSAAIVFTAADAYALNFNVQCSTDQAFVGGIVTGTGLNSPVAVTGLAMSTTYYCRVQATNNAGSSAWSSYVTIATQISPPVGGILVVTALTTQINYAFNTVSGASSYNVQRATNSTFTTGVATNSQASNTGFFSGLSPNTVYYFRVQAVDGSGNPGPYTSAGPYSSPASESTQPMTVLVVAGGGGGAGNCPTCGGAGGGGAGGLVYSTLILPGANGSVLNVVVGGGGAGGAGSNTSTGYGANGGASSYSGGAIAVNLSAVGGGGGRPQDGSAGATGGSGGGGSGGSSPAAGAGGAGTAGQGFAGGAGVSGLGGGGGGGAGAVGGVGGGSGGGGAGGVGLAYSISGASLFYAGGGGAGAYGSVAFGAGGNGGGGAGANSTGTGKGVAGTANTGGGGGGGNGSTLGGTGGNGGSGIVIFSYPTGSMTTSGGTVTTSGGNTIVTFRSSGTLTFVSYP